MSSKTYKRFKHFPDYHNFVGSLLHRYEFVPVWFLLECKRQWKRGALEMYTISANLTLSDNSILSMNEIVECGSAEGTQLMAYSYFYRRPDGFWFRYEMDEHPKSDPIKYPQFHLHTGIYEKHHFLSRPVDIETVMEIIKRNFFE